MSLQAVGELDILTIEEESLIKTTEFSHNTAAYKQKRAAEPINVTSLCCAIPSHILCVCPAKEPRQLPWKAESRHNGDQWRWKPATDILYGTITVQNIATHRPNQWGRVKRRYAVF
jgi:hypothetical protein